MARGKSDITSLGWPDYAFSGVASLLAVYSAGIGIGVANVSFFFILLIAVGTIASAVIQRFVPRQYAGADGFLYTLFAIVAMIYAREMNGLLPGEGFPENVRVAGWLCWTLVFGSFFMWRDSTLLFQAVPGIALFGLVGTWDTFRAAPFLFFGFLLCFATMFARAHARTMMERARDSGFTSNALDVSKSGGFQRALRNGPWRWVAGPEWALGSALVVVLLSLAGAPAFQFALKGVSGLVKLPAPTSAAMRRNYFGSSPASTNFGGASLESIGNGPRTELLKKPIFKLYFKTPAYLRYRTYSAYNPTRGWSEVTAMRNASTANAYQTLVHGAKKHVSVNFVLDYLQGKFEQIPVPGDVDHIAGIPETQERLDGTINNADNFGPGAPPIEGSVIVPEGQPTSVNEMSDYLQEYLSNDGISDRVRALADSAVAGAKSDYEKAEDIRKLISQRCIYDLNADAVPEGQDGVDFFLFQSRTGYCDLFASAMTIMARAEGLPARLVIGWAPFTDPHPGVDGYRTYYDTDYHAWAEIYFADIGWVRFDATDDAKEVPGSGRGAATTGAPWYAQASFFVAIGALLAIAIGATLVPFLRGRRFVFSIRMRSKPQIERMYAELVRNLEIRTGKPRRPSQTPYEYLETVEAYLDGSYEAVREATVCFVSTFYGSAEPPPDAVAQLKEKMQAAKRVLKSLKRPKD